MRYKIIISFVLIISILLTSFVALPVQTVSASAQSDMDRFINNFGLQSYSGSIPALIWYLIYYLGSMGFGIFTVGQLADAMNDPDIKPLINDWIIRTMPGGSEHLLLQQISESGGGAITVNANQWAVDRSAISSMFRNGKLDDMRQSYTWNAEPKKIKYGNEYFNTIVIENTDVNETTFPFLNYSSINYLKSISIVNNLSSSYKDTITYAGYKYQSRVYNHFQKYTGYYTRFETRRTDTDVYPTGTWSSFSSSTVTGNDVSQIVGAGVIPVLTYLFNDGSVNANGERYKLTMITWFANKITESPFTQDFKFKVDTIGTVARLNTFADYNEPAITDKLLRDITPNIQYIQPTDTVTITPDARILAELEQIRAGIRDLDIAVPDVVEVPVTTTSTVIREVVNNQTIINNPVIPDVIVDVPALEFDFPEVEKFKVPSLIMSKFPFSIPFDLYNAFAVLRVTKTDPIFTIPVILSSYNISEEIVLDFTKFDWLVELVRWFVLLSFIVTLVILTRRLVKG